MMGYINKFAVLVLVLSIYLYPAVGQTDFSVNITPANIDFGIVNPGSVHSANYSVVNQGASTIQIEITMLYDQVIDVIYPERINLNPGESTVVPIEFQAPTNPGRYRLFIKFRPVLENQGSGGGAAPEFQGSINFTVEGVGVSLFQVSSGNPNTPLLAFLKVEAFNRTISVAHGTVRIRVGGEEIQMHSISISGGGNVTQLNWSQVLEFDQVGTYTADLSLSINSSRGIVDLEVTTTFIVGSAIPWLSIKTIEIDDEGSKALSIMANNNGTLPYLLSLKVSVKEQSSGEEPIVRLISDIVQEPTSYLIPIIVQNSGEYVAVIQGLAGEITIERTINLGQVSQTAIGPSPNSPPNYSLLLFGVIAAAAIASIITLFKKYGSKPFSFTIFAVHLFISSGEGLLTYNVSTKEIQEMDFDRLGRVVMTINSIEMIDGKFVSVMINDTRKMFVTLINGLGFAVEVPVELRIEDVEKKSKLLETLKRIEKERGEALKNGLVDIAADYMEYCLGEI